MARTREVTLTAFNKSPINKQTGNGPVCNTANSAQIPYSFAADNTFEQRWLNQAGTDVVRGCSVDSGDNFLLSEELYQPMYQPVKLNIATTASIVTQHFMIIPTAARLVGISEIHATAESTATALTSYIEKLTGTTAPGSGSTIMSGTFDMKGTANTVQTATLYAPNTGDSDDPLLQFAAGDRVGFVISGAATELAGMVISLAFAPLDGSKWIVYNMNANGDLVDQTFFLANRDYIATNAYYVHSTKCSVASTVVQLVKDTGTNAPGAGTDMLTNTSNTGFDCTAANDTVQTGAFATTAGLTRLAPGNRLSLDFAGTLTALAGVIVVVVLQKTQRRLEITFTLSKNANLGVDQALFIARRNYKITDVTCVFSVTAGGASKLQLTRDTLTDAPGAGTDLLSNNTNAGFDLAATANTVQVGTFVDTRFNYLMLGDRLSLDFANAAQASAGLTVTISLDPA